MITARRPSTATRTLLRICVAAGSFATLLGLAGCAGPGWKYRSLSVVPMESNGQLAESKTIVRRNQGNRFMAVQYDGMEAHYVREGALRFVVTVESRDLLPYDLGKARFSLTARGRALGDSLPKEKVFASMETTGPKARSQAALANAQARENPHSETGWDLFGRIVQRMAGRSEAKIQNDRREKAEQAKAWESEQKEELESLQDEQDFWASQEFSPRILRMGQRATVRPLFPILPEADTLILVTDCLGEPDSIRFLQTDPHR